MFPEVQLGGSIQIDAPMLGPKQRTLSPAVTGGAILAVKVRTVYGRPGSLFPKYIVQYDKGVMVAGDTLGAYGGLHRFRDIRRVMRLNENVIVTYTGDTADFQHLQGRVLRTRDERTQNIRVQNSHVLFCSENTEQNRTLNRNFGQNTEQNRTEQENYFLEGDLIRYHPKMSLSMYQIKKIYGPWPGPLAENTRFSVENLQLYGLWASKINGFSTIHKKGAPP